MALETAGHLSDHGTHLPGTGKDVPKQHDHAKQQLIEDIVARAIDRINAADIPESEKARLRDQLRGALDTGDLSAVGTILANVATQLKTEEARDDVADLNYLIHESYPEYAEYSNEGRKYIRDQQARAFANSPELRQLKEQYDAMPPAEKQAAESEQKENQRLISEMLHGSDKERYKDYHESLRILRSTGLANGPEGKEILDAIAKGESPKDFRKRVHDAVGRSAEKNDKFVNEYVQKIPQASQDALHKEFGEHINTAKLMIEWGKISRNDKDAAYRAMAEAGNDISKLPPEQQRIVHLANVGIALETKNTIEGAMGIIARNQGLAKALEDTNISVEEKMAMLDKEAQRQGIVVPRDNYYKQGLKQTVLAINETVEEGKRYDPNNSAQFLKEVGANIQENYAELTARKGSDGKSYSYGDIGYYVAISNSEAGVPDWAKGNKEAEARYAQQAAEWEKIENSYRKDYGYTSPPSMRQLENESMTKLAKLETVQAEISVNTPAMTISPAFSLPPGIDPKDLRALAQAGVSNPELASPANEKQPNTQQSMQVAEAEIGGRQS